MWKNKSQPSIKRTTVLSSLAGIVISSIIAVIFINQIVAHWLTDEFHENLLAKVHMLQTLTEYEYDGLELDFVDKFMPEYSRNNEPEYFQIWTEDQKTFKQSASLKNTSLELKKTPLNEIIIQDVILPDGREGRIAYVTFHVEDHRIFDHSRPYVKTETPIVTISTAREKESLDSAITKANVILLIIFTLLTGILSMIVWFSVSKGLMPLNELQKKLLKLNYKKNNAYINLSVTPEEVSILVKRFNGLLESIRSSFQREQKFSSNVAHELRTPIAEIRTITDVYLLDDNLDSKSYKIMQDIQSISKKMGDLINGLLSLARAEKLEFENTTEKIDYIKTTEAILVNCKSLIKNKNLKIINKQNLSTELSVPYTPFTQIINNLLSNAIKHSSKDSTVSINFYCDDTTFIFKVSNITPDLDNSDLERMFDRLWKKDMSRANDSGFGIGLSLVKVYCESQKYSLNTSLKNSIFTITVSGKNN